MREILTIQLITSLVWFALCSLLFFWDWIRCNTGWGRFITFIAYTPFGMFICIGIIRHLITKGLLISTY